MFYELTYSQFALQLILNEKGFPGRRTFVLHQGEGPIRNIKWRSHFIAWANDLVSVLVMAVALTSCTWRSSFSCSVILCNPRSDLEISSVVYCSYKNHNFANIGHKNMNNASF